MTTQLILLLLSLVLALCAAVGVPSPPRFNLFAGAFFFYVLSLVPGLF